MKDISLECLEVIKIEAGPEVSDDTINTVINEVAQDMGLVKTAADYSVRAQAHMDRTAFIAASKIRKAQSRLESRIKRRGEYQEMFKVKGLTGEAAAEAIHGKYVGTWERVHGGRDSTARKAMTQGQENLNFFINSLEEKDLVDVLKDGSLTREIDAELWELRKGGNTSREKPISGSKIAHEIARIKRAAYDRNYHVLHDAGASIQYIQGYMGRQIHNAEKIAKVDFQTWFDWWVKDGNIDAERTFGRFEPENLAEARGIVGEIDAEAAAKNEDLMNDLLEGLDKDEAREMKRAIVKVGRYDDKVREFMANVHDDIITDAHSKVSGGRHTDASVSHQRVIHVKDAAAFSDYRVLYGNEEPFNTIIRDIELSARTAAMIEDWGPIPRQGLEDDIAWMKSQLPPAEMQAFMGATKRRVFRGKRSKIEQAMNEAEGKTMIPGVSMGAQISVGIRSIAQIRLLGRATLGTIPDLASATHIVQAGTGKNILQLHGDLMVSFLESIPPVKRKRIARKLGLIADDYIGARISRYMGAEDMAPGFMSDMARRYNHLTGLIGETRAMQKATAQSISRDYADAAGKSWDDLPDKVRNTMDQYGEGPKGWDLMRMGVEDFEDGTRGLTPEAIRNVPDAEVRKIFPGQEPRVVKNRTARSLLAIYQESAELATMTPGPDQRRFMFQGTTPDELAGQLYRFFWMFKSPSMAMGSVYKRVGGVPWRDLVKGKGDNLAIVGMAVDLVILGYVSWAAYELSAGRTPPDPRDPETFKEVLVRSGAGGMVADLGIGGRYKGEKGLKRLAGPVLGQVDDILPMLWQLSEGKISPSKYYKLLNRNLPLPMNHALLMGLINKHFHYQIMEKLNRGYIRREKRRVRKTPGLLTPRQQYWALGDFSLEPKKEW